MLVLTRRPMEGVVVTGPCRIVFLGTRWNGSVRLGFEAEPSVVILRDEVLAREQTNQKEVRDGE